MRFRVFAGVALLGIVAGIGARGFGFLIQSAKKLSVSRHALAVTVVSGIATCLPPTTPHRLGRPRVLWPSTFSPLDHGEVEKPSSGNSPCRIANRLAPARLEVPIFV